ncbi:MAG: TetR/AcrR family transcriptional regulator [Cyclobacteriaceae bacterium]
METKEKILHDAEELFVQFGVRSVTMDDVAREASMSKKTLYQYFDNKDKLVSEVALHHLDKETEEFLEIEATAQDAIHELFLVTLCLRKHVFKMNPSLLFDMQKYHAEAWGHYMNFKNTTVRGYIERNISRGIKEGYFRSEIDPKIISILRVEQVQLAFNNKIFPQKEFDFTKVQLQILDHFIHGLLTTAGKERYEEHLQSETLNHAL